MPDATDENPLVTFRRLKIWQDHAAELDEGFHSFQSRFAEPFSSWVRSNMDVNRSLRTVFYPLGGPDIAFARLLYPDADTYILCGLEPCMPRPDAPPPSKASIAKALAGLRATVGHFFAYSFFTAKEMREQFHDLYMPGVVLALLTLTVRLGLHPSSIEFLWMGSGAGAAPGIGMTVEGGGRTRRIFYFQQDLRDGYFSGDGAFSRFVAGFGRFGALIKSASYLLHEPNFSNVRDFILRRCSTIVQDPSGIPFRDFSGEEFNLSLYGSYTNVLPLFHRYEQPELARAFATAESAPALDFGFGYFHQAVRASLMLATAGAVS